MTPITRQIALFFLSERSVSSAFLVCSAIRAGAENNNAVVWLLGGRYDFTCSRRVVVLSTAEGLNFLACARKLSSDLAAPAGPHVARKAEVERSKCCALGSLMCRFITVKIVRDDTCQSVKAESSQPTASSVRVVAQLFLLFSISRPAHKSRLVCFHLVFCHPSGWHSFNGAQQHAIPFIPAETEDVATDENCRRLFHFSSLRSDIFRRQRMSPSGRIKLSSTDRFPCKQIRP